MGGFFILLFSTLNTYYHFLPFQWGFFYIYVKLHFLTDVEDSCCYHLELQSNYNPIFKKIVKKMFKRCKKNKIKLKEVVILFYFFKDMLFLHLQHIKNIGTEIMDTPFYEKKLLIWELRRLSCKFEGKLFSYPCFTWDSRCSPVQGLLWCIFWCY